MHHARTRLACRLGPQRQTLYVIKAVQGRLVNIYKHRNRNRPPTFSRKHRPTLKKWHRNNTTENNIYATKRKVMAITAFKVIQGHRSRSVPTPVCAFRLVI